MKHQIGTEGCGNQVYVITIDDATDGECLRDFLEQHDYTFFRHYSDLKTHSAN